MAIHHASSGEIIDVRPLGARLHETQSSALVREDQLEVMRFVLPAGKELPEHAVRGPITIQCLEGVVEVSAHGTSKTVRAGELMYLADQVPHSLRASEDSSVLVSMRHEKPSP